MRSVAVLALALGMLTLDAGSSTPVSAEEPGSATLTSQLLPGWNMVAWLGPEAPVSELFDAIPALRQVSAWDSEEQRYRQALRTSTPRDGLTRLTAGMGLWLRVGGDEPVEWTRPLSEGHVLLSLRSGLNLVGWMGRDGESFAESAGRAGDALVLASRWNAATQSYELFGPPAKDALRLNRGDAIWVELNDDARWWQSATFEFASDIPADQQVAIRDEMLRVVEFFEERYAIEPAQLSVAVGVEAAEDAGATAASIAISSSAAESRAIADTLAREYFHVVRQDLAGGSDSPAWMTAGASEYAVGAYRQARGETTAPGLHAERWLDLLYTATPALPELEQATSLLAAGAAADSLGALAAEWLVERAGEPALFEYQRLLPASKSWAEAFEAAFGIAVGDFYEAFAQHRERRAPPGSDRSDGRTEPTLTFLGDVPDETEAAIGREFQELQSFFRERFGDWPGDYRLDVAADWESAAPQYSRPSGEPPSGVCVHPFWPSKLLVILPCPQPLPDYVARFHFENVRERLAPGWNSTPPTADGTPYDGPLWLNLGAERYVEYAYLTFADPESADQHRAWYESEDARTAQPLRSLETMVGTSGSSGPGFLAAEWLALRAGDEALFEYYWLLQFLPDWRDAFEMAFGLTVEEFYEAFARHRSELAPPLPHLADDRNEPVLVLLGDIAPGAEAAVRAQFEGAQEFFGERLGAPPVDYTVYVAAGDESAAAPFRKVFGRDPDPGFCFTASTGAAMVIALDCGRSLAHYLGEYHFRDVREQLLSGEWTGAPRSHGPKWLRLGAEGWAEYTFLAASGVEPLDRLRGRLVRQAARTAQPLRSVLGSGGADLPYEVAEALGFFAVEQLVARAGETAVLEYYRLLLTSEDWEEAFEGAFGITVEEFYEAFAEVRDELTTVTPGDADYVLPLEGPVWLNYGRDAYAEYTSVALVGDENPDWVWSTFAG